VAVPITAKRELFSQDAPDLLAHDETPQALAIAVLNLMRMPKEQVQKGIARITSKHSLPQFGHSWRIAIQSSIN
jgi:hypothetical protein